MGQLVRQRQAGEQLPAQQQQQGGVAKPQAGGGMAAAGGPGSAAAPPQQGPSRADIDRIDTKEENDMHGNAQQVENAGDSRFQANAGLIREREKLIIEQLRRELDTSRMTQISEDTQAQVRARIREIVNSIRRR